MISELEQELVGLEQRVALLLADRRVQLVAVVRRCVDAELARLVDLELEQLQSAPPANGNGHTNGNGNGHTPDAEAVVVARLAGKPSQRSRSSGPKPCSRCKTNDRAAGQTWCPECKRDHERAYRARRRELRAAAGPSRGSSAPAEPQDDSRPAEPEPEPQETVEALAEIEEPDHVEPLEELDPPEPEPELERSPVLSVSEAVRLYGPAPPLHRPLACGRLIYNPSTSSRTYCDLDPSHSGPCSPIAPPRSTSKRPRTAGKRDPARAVAFSA